MIVFFKFSYKFNVIRNKILMDFFFMEFDSLILKFIWKWRIKVVKIILNYKKMDRFVLWNSKIYYKVIVEI